MSFPASIRGRTSLSTQNAMPTPATAARTATRWSLTTSGPLTATENQLAFFLNSQL
jgi:hypothetical protein